MQWAASNRDIGSIFHVLKKLLGFFLRGRKVGIAKEKQFSWTFEHAFTDGVSFSLVGLVSNQSEVRMLFAKGGNDLVGAVTAAIADDGNVPRVFLSRIVLLQAAEGRF